MQHLSHYVFSPNTCKVIFLFGARCNIFLIMCSARKHERRYVCSGSGEICFCICCQPKKPCKVICLFEVRCNLCLVMVSAQTHENAMSDRGQVRNLSHYVFRPRCMREQAQRIFLPRRKSVVTSTFRAYAERSRRSRCEFGLSHPA